MKKLWWYVSIGLSFSIIMVPNVWAQADVGTKVCRDIQLNAQEAAPDEVEWKNHGKQVSTAAKVVSLAVEAYVITEECSSCIINQFARRIPIAEQEPCGPDRICGDGELDPDEECDDGNNIDGDGCNAECIIEFCGDGILQPNLGEECDDGNNDDGDGCAADCTIEADGCGDCNVAQDTPGCSDATCQETVCDIDPFCCNVEWDQICADEALQLCDCNIPECGDCNVAQDTPGCSSAECESTICAIDPFCCDVLWDSLCVDQALELCDCNDT